MPQVDSASPTLTPGNVYVAFNVTIKNIDAKSRQVSPVYWALRDHAGNIYPASYNIHKTSPEVKILPSISTIPSDIVNGYVFFEVPSDHGAWKSLRYTGDGYTDVIFDL